MGNQPWPQFRNGIRERSIDDLLTSVTIILLRVKLNRMLNIKTKSYTFQIQGREEFGAKDRKDAPFYYSFYLSSEESISIDQSVQMYFTVFGFVKLLILNITFQGKYFLKNNFLQCKNLFTSQELLLNSVTFGVISVINVISSMSLMLDK